MFVQFLYTIPGRKLHCNGNNEKPMPFVKMTLLCQFCHRMYREHALATNANNRNIASLSFRMNVRFVSADFAKVCGESKV